LCHLFGFNPHIRTAFLIITAFGPVPSWGYYRSMRLDLYHQVRHDLFLLISGVGRYDGLDRLKDGCSQSIILFLEFLKPN